MTDSLSTRTPNRLTNSSPDIHTRPIAPIVTEKTSLTTEDAVNLIIKEKVHDRHLDGVTNILYEFFSESKSDHFHYHSPTEFNANQKHQTRRAIQAWEDLANVTFTELPEPTSSNDTRTIVGKHKHNDHRIVFGQTEHIKSGGIISNYPGAPHASLAILGASTVDSDFDHNDVKRGVLTTLIGGALGLGTPLQTRTTQHVNSSGEPQDSAFHTKDNLDYTIMSPHIGVQSKSDRPAAAMMHDIAAVQKMYGANLKTRNTDTVYGFNSNSGRDFLSLKSDKDKALFCVWDGGGNDTLDFSGFSQNQKINLYERSFSDVGGMKGNVSIARGVTLENAVGGAGDDLLIGNHVDNRLKGGAGADSLEGGNGADTFIYDDVSDSTPENPDLITDFSSGTDKIDLSGVLRNNRIGSLNFVANFTGKAGDVVLSYNAITGQGSLAVDLTGNGQASLLIKTVGQVRAGDVLVSTLQQPSGPNNPVTPPPPETPQTARNEALPLSQTFNSGHTAQNQSVSHVALPNITPTSSIVSQVVSAHTPVTVVSVKNEHWNYYINLPKEPKDNDIVIVNSTALNKSKIIDDNTGQFNYLGIINPGEKRALKYSAETKTWQPQETSETQWIGSKILLGTSHAVVSLNRHNWRPQARLPIEGTNGDIIRLHSDADLPIDIKTSDVTDPTVWQLTKGDAIDFQYSAKTGSWEMLRPTGQFYRAQSLVTGVMPPPSTYRTYVEVANGNWQESITLPTENVHEGHQVIIKTTADQSFKVKHGQTQYTIGPGESVSFKADKNGRYAREPKPADYYAHLTVKSKLHYFNQDGVWRTW